MDKSENVREYISQNEGTTEYRIAKFMVENNICARETTHNVIYNDLIPAGKVVDRKKGNSFHKLYINNKNEFNKIVCNMDRLFEAIKRVNSFVDADLVKKNRLLRGMIELAQRVFYNAIASLACSIDANIKSTDDREILYISLVNILVASSGLNRKTSNFFYDDLETTIDELHIQNKTAIMDKKTKALLKNIIETTLPFTSNLA